MGVSGGAWGATGDEEDRTMRDDKLRAAALDVLLCFAYDFGRTNEALDDASERWWTDRAEDCAERGLTSDDVRAAMLDRLRAAFDLPA